MDLISAFLRFEFAERSGNPFPFEWQASARKIRGLWRGNYRGGVHPSVTIRANWRIVFRFENGHALDVDLTDYH